MGNAASCQACGSGKALKTIGSVDDLQDTDYYGAADPGSEDEIVSLVREGEGNKIAW